MQQTHSKTTIEKFNEYSLIMRRGNKSGLINRETEILCEPIYDVIRDFKNGFAAACLNGKWGFINKQGKAICEFIYDRVLDFDSDGFAAVFLGGKIFYINEEGKVIL